MDDSGLREGRLVSQKEYLQTQTFCLLPFIINLGQKHVTYEDTTKDTLSLFFFPMALHFNMSFWRRIYMEETNIPSGEDREGKCTPIIEVDKKKNVLK